EFASDSTRLRPQPRRPLRRSRRGSAPYSGRARTATGSTGSGSTMRGQADLPARWWASGSATPRVGPRRGPRKGRPARARTGSDCRYPVRPVGRPVCVARSSCEVPLPPAHETGHRGLPATAAAELLHQLRQLGVLLDQSIHLGQVRPRAGSDPPPARAVEDRGLTSLARGHRPDDRLGPPQVAAIDRLLRLFGHGGHVRAGSYWLSHRASLPDLLDLPEAILE